MHDREIIDASGKNYPKLLPVRNTPVLSLLFHAGPEGIANETLDSYERFTSLKPLLGILPDLFMDVSFSGRKPGKGILDAAYYFRPAQRMRKNRGKSFVWFLKKEYRDDLRKALDDILD